MNVAAAAAESVFLGQNMSKKNNPEDHFGEYVHSLVQHRLLGLLIFF